MGLALFVAILLTLLSPLKEPTAEILARTRPNFFDLLIAVFSGIAGAYAVEFVLVGLVASAAGVLLGWAVHHVFVWLLAGLVELAEEVRGFRNLDCRDLTGFVDGTENPQDEHRAEVALAADGEFAGGSYIHVQRWVHAMSDWEKLAQKEQEDIIGRTKPDNIEYESAAKPLTAHIKRVNLKTPKGESMEILRQSMPWGTMTEQGLYFISCCRTPQHFNAMLASMYKGEGSHFDHLLRFTRAVTGAAFFAPSIDFLVAQGK